jgi:hypothetical protein
VICVAHDPDRAHARASKYSYGTDIGPIFDPQDKEHRGRQIHQWADGHDHIHHKWSEVIARVHLISRSMAP